MRKNVRRLALFLAMVLAFTATAFAADQDDYDSIVGSNIQVDTTELADTAFGKVFLAAGSDTIEIEFFGKTAPEKAHITYKDASIAVGDMYLVTLLAKNTVGEYVPSDGNIQYIDQVTCTEAGVIKFDVYPSAVTDGIIAVYGASGELKVAVVEGSLALGDVTKDGKVNSADAMLLLQYVAGLASFDDTQKRVGNVTGGVINSADAMLLLQYVAGLATLE